jgi:HSP20 family protein
MNLVKRNNQRTLYDPLRSFFDIEDVFSGWPAIAKNTLPAVNVSEDEKNYHIDMVAPGFKKEDFKINVNDDVLTISAETKSESENKNDNRQYSRREYSYSSFTRSFTLPDNAKDDAITANYTDGILKLMIPKTEEQTKATKEIKIG